MVRSPFTIRVLALCAVVLGSGGTTTGPESLAAVERVDFVAADLARWRDVPGIDVPLPRFVRAVAVGKSGSGTGTPGVPATLRWRLDEADGDVSLMRIAFQPAGGPESYRYTSYVGPFQMSTQATGPHGTWSRRVLDLEFLGKVPLDNAVARSTPALHGVAAESLNVDLRWKILVGPGTHAERWFDISIRVADVATVDVEINGRPYVFDAYVVNYRLTNVHGLFERTITGWYIPAIGWVGRLDGSWKSWSAEGWFAYDRISFEVDESAVSDITRFAR